MSSPCWRLTHRAAAPRGCHRAGCRRRRTASWPTGRSGWWTRRPSPCPGCVVVSVTEITVPAPAIAGAVKDDTTRSPPILNRPRATCCCSPAPRQSGRARQPWRTAGRCRSPCRLEWSRWLRPRSTAPAASDRTVRLPGSSDVRRIQAVVGRQVERHREGARVAAACRSSTVELTLMTPPGAALCGTLRAVTSRSGPILQRPDEQCCSSRSSRLRPDRRRRRRGGSRSLPAISDGTVIVAVDVTDAPGARGPIADLEHALDPWPRRGHWRTGKWRSSSLQTRQRLDSAS